MFRHRHQLNVDKTALSPKFKEYMSALLSVAAVDDYSIIFSARAWKNMAIKTMLAGYGEEKVALLKLLCECGDDCLVCFTDNKAIFEAVADKQTA